MTRLPGEGSNSSALYLSPEQMERLQQAGLGLEVPAGMRQFETVDAFMEGENNFHITFTAESERVRRMYQSKLVFQRFSVVQPEELALLEELRGKDWERFDAGEQELLYAGYRSMALLVDISDPGVMVDGQINDWYLCG